MLRIRDGNLRKIFFTNDAVMLSVPGVMRVLMCCMMCVSSCIVNGTSLVVFGGVCVWCLICTCSDV